MVVAVVAATVVVATAADTTTVADLAAALAAMIAAAKVAGPVVDLAAAAAALVAAGLIWMTKSRSEARRRLTLGRHIYAARAELSFFTKMKQGGIARACRRGAPCSP